MVSRRGVCVEEYRVLDLLEPRLASTFISEGLGEVEADALIVLASKAGARRVAEKFSEAKIPIELGDFDGSLGSTLTVYTSSRWKRIVLAGMGSDDDWEDCVERARVAAASAIRLLKDNPRVNTVAIYVDELLASDRCGVSADWLVEQILVASHLANYVFSYRSRSRKPHQLSSIGVVASVASNARQSSHKASSIAEAVYIARNIANAPSNIVNPDTLELLAYEAAKRHGLGLRILHVGELEAEGMNGILAVGAGSVREPRLIILEYSGGGGRVAVVGKTVTFDSGGLDLKTPSSMQDMKFDKSGGGVAFAVALAASHLKLPVSVVAAMPVVENMPSGRAYRPRDILVMRDKTTVEVTNTDAEGRLALADAISYVAEKYAPEAIIDVATLTGAIVVALGNHAAGLFSNNEELAKKIEYSAWRVWEPVWRMPLWKPYREQLESDIADTANTGGSAGGAITAAAFLERFTDGRPWAHLDIAGVAWVHDKGPSKPYYPKGATGWGVRTLIGLLSKT